MPAVASAVTGPDGVRAGLNRLTSSGPPEEFGKGQLQFAYVAWRYRAHPGGLHGANETISPASR